MLKRTTTRLALIAFIAIAVWALASSGPEAFIMVLVAATVISATPLALGAIAVLSAGGRLRFEKAFRAAAPLSLLLIFPGLLWVFVSLKMLLVCQVASFLALLVTWDCVTARARKTDPRQPVPGSSTAVPQPAAVNTQAQIDQLEKLSALKASGAIDDEEFARMKSQLMRQAGH